MSSCGGLPSQDFLIRSTSIHRDCHARSAPLEPVMRSLQSQAMPIVQALWRHRWLAVGTAWLVCTAGWIGAAFIPTKYESTARVYLNADPLSDPTPARAGGGHRPWPASRFHAAHFAEQAQSGTADPPHRSRYRGPHPWGEGSAVQTPGERYLGHAGYVEPTELFHTATATR